MWAWLFFGCADITPIEDGAVHGAVEVVQDWFTSAGLVRHGDTTLMIDAGFRADRMAASLSAGVVRLSESSGSSAILVASPCIWPHRATRL